MSYLKSALGILLILSFFTNNIDGQSLWFQEDATWVHRAIQFNAGGYLETIVEKDTILNGQACKKLSRKYELFDFLAPFPLITNGDLGPLFMYASEDDNQVYYYENNSFKLIYDFNASVGDVLELPFPEIEGLEIGCPFNLYKIDSVGVEEIDGVELKWFSVIPTEESQYFYTGRIYQKIGSTSLYFHTLVEPSLCLGTVTDMNFIDESRCFSDSQIEYKHPGVIGFLEGNCYAPGTDPMTPVTEIDLTENIEVHPNPVTDILTIDYTGSSELEGEVMSVSGARILTFSISSDQNTIDLSSVHPGMYIITINGNSRPVKFIKN